LFDKISVEDADGEYVGISRQSVSLQSDETTHLRIKMSKEVYAGKAGAKRTKSDEPVSNDIQNSWPPILDAISQDKKLHRAETAHSTFTRYALRSMSS
jgi:hypothetical protein